MNNTFATLLNQINAPILAIDEVGTIIYFNQAVCDYFNVHHLQVGQSLTNTIIHPDFMRLVVNQVERGEIFLPDVDRYLSLEMNHITGMGSLIVMHDVSNFKALDRIKSNLANEVSQSLRSPLTAVIGYAELLGRMGALNDQQKNFVERITMSVHSMTHIINDLMELEKIEMGIENTKQLVDMRLIVKYSIDGLHSAIASKKHTLQYELPEGLPQVEGNPVRLRQMVNNILQNAIQYTDDEGIIAIHLGTEDGFIYVSIEDNGLGIPPEDQPYIFDKFYRSQSTIMIGARTGLGLSIVKNIVDQHQGRIWVESQVGAGSRFIIMLPCATA
jgi:two-component system, OmpR family, phosphate regulon sensor histidine kinase PhoR